MILSFPHKLSLCLFASLSLYFNTSQAADISPNNAQQLAATNNSIRLGPGDSKVGYESENYATDSRAIEARKGVKADLIRVINTPPLGLPNIRLQNIKSILGKSFFLIADFRLITPPPVPSAISLIKVSPTMSLKKRWV